MNAMQAVDYIFDHEAEFEAKYASVIKKFEDKGIDHAMAKALAITVAANCKAVTDALKA